jgi:hypothetical protein
LTIATSGCRGTTEIVDDAEVFYGVVAGLVQTADGTAIGQSRVLVERRFYCAAASDTTYGTSTAHGRFAVLLERLHDSAAVDCLRVVAEPPAGSGMSTSDAAVDTLAYRSGQVPPLDTAFVTLVLKQ